MKLLGPVTLLLLRSYIMSMVSLFVHDLIKITWVFQEMIKRFMSKFDLWLNIWCNRTEKIIEQISCIFQCSKKRVFIILGISESLHFMEILNFMPFHVFLMFLRLVLKNHHNTFFYFLLCLWITYFYYFYNLCVYKIL